MRIRLGHHRLCPLFKEIIMTTLTRFWRFILIISLDAEAPFVYAFEVGLTLDSVMLPNSIESPKKDIKMSEYF